MDNSEEREVCVEYKCLSVIFDETGISDKDIRAE